MNVTPPSPTWSDESRSLLTGDNALYVAHVYASYLRDPTSVSSEWREYFSLLKDDEAAVLKDLFGPTWASRSFPSEEKGTPPVSLTNTSDAISDSLRALALVQAYRTQGHRIASLDPLGLSKQDILPVLDPRTYDFRESDYDRPIFMNNVLGFSYATLREILTRLRQIYCGSISVQFLHIKNQEQKLWLQQRIEGENKEDLGLAKPIQDSDLKKRILQELTEAEGFEQFLHKKFPAAKRFGLDGAESLIPGLMEALTFSSKVGVEETVIGMAHRGRLNVLANIMRKPWQAIFAEFQGHSLFSQQTPGSGDVKYHLGASADRDFEGRKMHLSLTANPSHLEAVNPLVMGKVRAKQDQRKDKERTQVMGLLLHGDAAFAGQGIVVETLMLSLLQGYRTGGTFHVVINNQIGFTTQPEEARSSIHCSDIALAIKAPIFHVNGDDPEAVVKVMRLAAEYRHTFKSDVVVDLVCYRRFGHNEGDEPVFTQPLMYKAIAEHPSVCTLYAQKLVQEASISQAEATSIQQNFEKTLQKNFQAATSYKPPKTDWFEGKWEGFSSKPKKEALPLTGITKKTLLSIGTALSQTPDSFHLHPKLARSLTVRQAMVKGDHPIDWSMAEALAFGSLLEEGYRVRLSGQDTARGTFSQRHAVFSDQRTEEKYIALNHLSPTQAPFEIWNSPLAEASVLGFELGYSFAEPEALVLWEAQFGDFANGAQVIIDQFLSSGESKWLRMSGLVMLLPHGYEGQGPEHSSARLERYLQLCAEDNMQVVNCSTPANYFHVLRRQLHRNYRKPLIVMTPKSLLRHKLSMSSLKEFEVGHHFQEVIPDPLTEASRVILCSGKVYYDLVETRDKNKIKDIAIIRLEQVYPFPHEALLKVLQSYKKADLVWCQEEPMNMGAWTFLDRRLETLLTEVKMKGNHPLYIGRPEAASPATGFLSRHETEQDLLVTQALNLKKMRQK